jgi:glutamate dehydrogenase
LIDRARDNLGFCRPELCVLLSYSKNALYSELLGSSLPDEPRLESELFAYFPEALQRGFPGWIQRHRLRREIIATSVCNELVNRVGVTFCPEISERTGLPWSSVAQAFVAARHIHDAPSLWHGVEALDNVVEPHVQGTLLIEMGRMLVNTTTWLLRTYGLKFDLDYAISSYREGVMCLAEQLVGLLPEEEVLSVKQRCLTLSSAGVPETLAERCALLPLLVSACDIVRVGRDLPGKVEDVARLYFVVGQRLGFGWLRRLARSLPVHRAWDKQAVSAAVDDLLFSQRELVREMLAGQTGPVDVEATLTAWSEPRQPLLTRSQQMLAELQALPTVDLAMLTVASRQLKALLGVAAG